MLSDKQLIEEMTAGRLVVNPYPIQSRIQPASLDLVLANEFAVYEDDSSAKYIDPRRGTEHRNPKMRKFEAEMYFLQPQGFCLARTEEFVGIGPHLVARVEGKSSLGRYGLMIHATAGFIDPGFRGHITLEFFNCTPFRIKLTPGMPICQLAVMKVDGEVNRPYGHPDLGSRYQDQTGVTLPR